MNKKTVNNILNKKNIAIAGVVLSALFVLMGILTFAGVFGGDASYPGSASYMYESGYATFGADFYNYVSNNAAEAASASRTAASNVLELCTLMKNICGIILMGFGLFGVCHFGILLCNFIEAEKVSEESVTVDVAEEINKEADETIETIEPTTEMEETEAAETVENENNVEPEAEVIE